MAFSPKLNGWDGKFNRNAAIVVPHLRADAALDLATSHKSVLSRFIRVRTLGSESAVWIRFRIPVGNDRFDDIGCDAAKILPQSRTNAAAARAKIPNSVLSAQRSSTPTTANRRFEPKAVIDTNLPLSPLWTKAQASDRGGARRLAELRSTTIQRKYEEIWKQSVHC